ncbi:hypothetical protein HNY73_004437 [Argiope bruennichi]|uniref:Uncharacterized protein n=1 Tax=Argiope bruennichi TaxID=94029 RepID=A0A8T0FQ00_ARGBR|nr:hypothetical protein HNY73_004437 [Argiope bruennichi]
MAALVDVRSTIEVRSIRRQFTGNDWGCSRKVSCYCRTTLYHTWPRLLTIWVRVTVLEYLFYSSYLSSSNFPLFEPMKEHLLGRYFRTDAEVQSYGTATWISSMPVSIFMMSQMRQQL